MKTEEGREEDSQSDPLQLVEWAQRMVSVSSTPEALDVKRLLRQLHWHIRRLQGPAEAPALAATPDDSKAALMEMLLNAIENALEGRANDFELSHGIVRRVDDLRLMAQPEGAPRPDSDHRWNRRTDADGTRWICRGAHHRSSACEWELEPAAPGGSPGGDQ